MQWVTSILWFSQGSMWCEESCLTLWIFRKDHAHHMNHCTFMIYRDCFRSCTCSFFFLDLEVVLWSKHLCVQCQVFTSLKISHKHRKWIFFFLVCRSPDFFHWEPPRGNICFYSSKCLVVGLSLLLVCSPCWRTPLNRSLLFPAERHQTRVSLKKHEYLCNKECSVHVYEEENHSLLGSEKCI